MAAVARELEQLAWGADEFEKQHDGLWAALLSARGQELRAGTGLVRTAAHTAAAHSMLQPQQTRSSEGWNKTSTSCQPVA
jgi:hypothetical protein